MAGIGVGNMCQHLDGVDSFCEKGVVVILPLEVAVAPAGSFMSVTPTIGMLGGNGDMEVVTDG